MLEVRNWDRTTSLDSWPERDRIDNRRQDWRPREERSKEQGAGSREWRAMALSSCSWSL